MKYIIPLVVLLSFTFFPLSEGFSITSPSLNSTEDVRPVESIADAEVGLTISANRNSVLHKKDSKLQARIEKRLHKKLYEKIRGPKRPRKPKNYEPMAIASLAASVGGALIILFSLSTLFFVAGVIFILGLASCILGVIFGGIALKKFKNGLNNGKGKGLALAGLITGIVPVVLFLALIIAFILTF